VSPETVERTVFHVERNDTNTLAILHDQVQGKIFDEEIRVVSERLAVKGVEEGVASTVSSRSATVRLTTFAILQRLTTKGTLVDLPLLGTGERNTVVFELGTELRQNASMDELAPTSITDLGASRHM
jgi:hypothetical protein